VRPLDRAPSIKLKLGLVIVGAVAGTTLAVVLGLQAELGWLLSALIAVVVGLLAIQFLARGMTSPLREMVAATTEMAKGDYSRRVTASSRDEVGDLARAFNKMSADLEEVDRMRRDLVANVSHELRTPISALQAVLENLADGIGSADRATLDTMLTQVHRLSGLVDQLLDLSKLESGAVPLEVGPVQLKPLLEQAIKESEIHAREAHHRVVRFQLTVEPADARVPGDAARLHQVATNLIENAVRHSPDGGTVGIRGAAAPHGVTIEVLDEGPGIREEDRQRVFERFYRSDESRSSDAGGSGLGLAIARWIVELHGGRIEAGENSPRGCKMSVTLPGMVR
jgi:signal transduction histidine kinase